MRIGFDAKRLYNNSTGLGNYSRNLLLNLSEFYTEHDYVLYTQKITESEETKALASNPSVLTRFPENGLRPLWRSYGIGSQLKKDQIDVYHGLSNEIPIGLRDIKTVVTIHDLIFKIYPQTYKIPDRLIYDSKCSYACKNADTIVAISETTKQDIIKFYGIKEGKIKVIHQSCNPLFYELQSEAELALVKTSLKLPTEFLLYVGSVIERKNLLLIIKALKELRGKTDIPLVVVGAGKIYKQKVEQHILENNLQNQVIWLSKLHNNKDLQAIYQLATIFIYPSLYEGFGIPIAEALLSGTPVITSTVSCLPEAAGPWAELVDPESSGDLASAIYRLLENPELRNERSEKGRNYALGKYDRAILTKQMIGLYQGM